MRMGFEGCEPFAISLFFFFQTIPDLRLEVEGRLEWCASYNPNGENINLMKIINIHLVLDHHKKHLVL
jgi:hypothetical protein